MPVADGAAVTGASSGQGFGGRQNQEPGPDGAMDDRERLDFALAATGTGLWTVDRGREAVSLDACSAALCGFASSRTLALRDWLGVFADGEAGAFEAMLGAASPFSPRDDSEIRIRRADTGVERWLAFRARSGAAGPSAEVVGTVRDVTNARQHDAQVHLLMREVTHRSKNLLAIIQAMARQTVKDSLTAADFENRFSSRLRGLSFSHELLAAQDWRGAALADLVHGHLQSVLEQHGDRIAVAGPAVFVRPEAAQNIGLALNELTSNALRFGALADTTGNVRLDWTVDADESGPRWLHLVWNEYGGRAVQPPARQGFGHKVMERVVARALDGSATMTFAPTGLQWSLKIPASHIVVQE